MQWLAISTVFAFAAAVQGLTGAGYALVAAPILLILAPDMVPVPLLLVEFVLMIAIVAREYHAIDLRTLSGALVAAFPGAVVGVSILANWPARTVNILTGAVITIAAALALRGATIPMTRWTMVGAGFGAGAMNSIAGMPGPPITLVYRPSDTAQLRTNLSLSFLVMSIFSLTMLYVERIGTLQSLTTAVQFIPAVVIGFVVARLFVHRVPGKRINRAVLWMTLLSGGLLLVRTLSG